MCGTYAAAQMTTLFLIRHGLTAQTGTTLYGQTRGIPLDHRGRAQAEQIAARFAAVKLTAIYSSPLERCVRDGGAARPRRNACPWSSGTS